MHVHVSFLYVFEVKETPYLLQCWAFCGGGGGDGGGGWVNSTNTSNSNININSNTPAFWMTNWLFLIPLPLQFSNN